MRTFGKLPPTSPDLLRDDARPYFLWWTDLTVGQFRDRLRSPDVATRAYWIAALLREANSRDVWLFVTAEQVRSLWPELVRYLGRSRAMWAYLLGVGPSAWPPTEARRA